MKFSSYFIDRPVFAAVLSAFILIAGAIALFKLPVSEYPEVVPPSVVVRAAYPGANPKIISETVAAPLEQEIVGVEDMLYMSSQATMDGSLALTVTFRIGTDIDRAQVQVQNRVAQALPRLPEEVRAIGVSTLKSSPAFLMVVHLTSPDGRYDSAVPAQLRHAQRPRHAGAHPGRRRRARVRRRRLRHARVARSAEDGRARPHHRRRGRAPSASRTCRWPPARSARRRRQARNSSSRSMPRAASRYEEEFGDVVVKTGAGRRSRAPARHRAPRTRRRHLRHAVRARQRKRRRHSGVPVAGFQRARALQQGPRRHGEAQEEFPAGHGLQDHLRPDAVRAPVHRRRDRDLARGRAAGGAGGHPVPADLARVDHSAGRRARVHHRHVRGALRARVLDQHAVAVRPGAGHRHRGRRLHRGGGKRRAAHRQWLETARGHQEGHERSEPPHHRHHAGAVRGVHPGGLRRRPHRPVLSTVRADDRHLDRHLRVQLADAVAGAGRGAAEAAWREARRADARHGQGVRPLLRALQPAVREIRRRVLKPASRVPSRRAPIAIAIYAGLVALTVFGFMRTPAGFIPQQDKLYLVGVVQLPPAASLERTAEVVRRMGEIAKAEPGVLDSVQFAGVSANGFAAQSSAALVFFPLKDFDERKGTHRRRDCRRAEPEVRAPSRTPTSPCSRRRPSSASAR